MLIAQADGEVLEFGASFYAPLFDSIITYHVLFLWNGRISEKYLSLFRVDESAHTTQLRLEKASANSSQSTRLRVDPLAL